MAHATAIHCVPEPCQVLGTPLKPFCLGHHLLFKRLGLAFASSAVADATPDQILEGIAICASRSYETTLAAMLTGEWNGIFSRWRSNLNGPWFHRRKADLEDAEFLFRAYLSDGYAHPPIRRYVADGYSLTITAPWEIVLKCELVRAGFSESEVLNGYLRARWYDYYTVRELHAAEVCKEAKRWKKIFWTAEDERAFREAGNE